MSKRRRPYDPRAKRRRVSQAKLSAKFPKRGTVLRAIAHAASVFMQAFDPDELAAEGYTRPKAHVELEQERALKR